MSLHFQPIGEIPAETVRVARAAFPKKNIYMQMRDELGTFYEDEDFQALFPRRGQPAETPWRLALILVMQFIEGLSDRQAADAVRARIDWKYALSLELSDPGFDYSILSEFRDRLLAGGAEALLLDKMLAKFKAKGYLKARGKQRTDSTHVLAAVRKLNRLEAVGETLRAALNALASTAPEWLRVQVTAEWFERYGRRIEEYRLPKGQAAREAYAAQIGADGFQLLEAIEAETTPAELRELTAVKTLRLMWEHQYQRANGTVGWRAAADLPPAGVRFDSPYDPEAHFGNKRSTTWTGYKVHLTETCNVDEPHLITHVETTSAVIPDVAMTETIHQSLADKELLPSDHIVDSGYIGAEVVVTSQSEQGVTLIGPMRGNVQWQAQAGQGYDLSHFVVDWETKHVTCPEGHVTKKWSPAKNAWGHEVINVKFRRKDCQQCAVRAQCTRAKSAARELTLRPRAQHEALRAARERQTQPEWKKHYDMRAGIEGTLSQGIRGFGLRESRYLGQVKTHLQHIVTAAAINVVRIIAWLNEEPLAKTRRSRFAALAATG